jgi:glyoxylase-like metal-dependent hydrolase (beta-lactamase superfamily II)
MHTFSSDGGAVCAAFLAYSSSFYAALGLLAASVLVYGQARTAESPRPPQAAMGDPVNLYVPNAGVYGPSRQDGEIHPRSVQGKVWLMAGEPGESNVAVQLGDQGVLVVDTGTQAMASKLLSGIQRLAGEHGGDKKVIRKVINTNGRDDHIGGNDALRQAGSQIVAGEEAAQQNAFVSPGAEVVAHENVLKRLVAENTAGGADPSRQRLWPTDTEGFEIDNTRFNGEAAQIYHPHNANTDGQLIVLFRGSDVVVAGDVVDMTSYPLIDVARGGTIDGELVALNKVIAMAAPANQAEGGTVIIPGHGRLCDQTDVVLYKNMITIIRNLVQYYKNQGRTLQEVQALKPSEGYDQRWGATSGPWTTRDFITAVYETLPAKGPVFFSMQEETLVPSTATPSGGKVF